MMGDSLPAINVDQLTDSMNNAVHGNVHSLPLPPLPLPVPVIHGNPPSIGLPDGPSRFPPGSGLPCLPVFNSLPALPLPVQVPGVPIFSSPSATLTTSTTCAGPNSDSFTPSVAMGFQRPMSTVLTAVLPASATPSTTAADSSSSGSKIPAMGASVAQSLPSNIPRCPPVLIMFSLRLPAPQSGSHSQDRPQETLAASSVASVGPRLPPLPPFPLLLPMLPPSQESHQPRHVLSLPAVQPTVTPSADPTSLPLPAATPFSQGFPLQPQPLQLPTSLPVLTLPPPQPVAMSQNDLLLPACPHQSAVHGPCSLPLPPLLPAPSNSVIPFPCPQTPLAHLSAGQTTLPLPPFPPQSFAAFVQSGLPLTTLSVSGLSFPQPLPQTSVHLRVGQSSAQLTVVQSKSPLVSAVVQSSSHLTVVQSKSPLVSAMVQSSPQMAVVQSKSHHVPAMIVSNSTAGGAHVPITVGAHVPFTVGGAHIPITVGGAHIPITVGGAHIPITVGGAHVPIRASSLASSTFSSLGYPTLPPLPMAMSTCTRFSLLPTFHIPPHSSAITDVSFLPPLPVHSCMTSLSSSSSSSSSFTGTVVDLPPLPPHPSSSREVGFSTPVSLLGSLTSGTSEATSTYSVLVSVAGQPAQLSPFPPLLFVPEAQRQPIPSLSSGHVGQVVSSTQSDCQACDKGNKEQSSEPGDETLSRDAASTCSDSTEQEDVSVSEETAERYTPFTVAGETSFKKDQVSEFVRSSKQLSHRQSGVGNSHGATTLYAALSSNASQVGGTQSDINNSMAGQSSVLFGAQIQRPHSGAHLCVTTTQLSCDNLMSQSQVTNSFNMSGMMTGRKETETGESHDMSGAGMALQDRSVSLLLEASPRSSYLSHVASSHTPTSIVKCNPVVQMPASSVSLPTFVTMQSAGKTALQIADPGSCNFGPQSGKLIVQRSDPCCVTAVSQGKQVAVRPSLHQLQQVNQNTGSVHSLPSHSLPLSSFYPVEVVNEINPDFIQQMPGAQPFSKCLMSCALEAQKKPVQHTHNKHQLLGSELNLLSVTEDPQPSFHQNSSSFSDMQRSGSLGLVNNCRDDLGKLPPVSSESCHFHSNLGGIGTEFQFSGQSAPTISVEHPSQTLLPSVGYSPPGLSNQGLSPNLFSPLGLNSMEQTVASKMDASLQIGSNTIEKAGGDGSSVASASVGLPTVSASGLDMYLLKADLSSVDGHSAGMTSMTLQAGTEHTTNQILHPKEKCNMDLGHNGDMGLASTMQRGEDMTGDVMDCEETHNAINVPLSAAKTADMAQQSCNTDTLMPVFSGQFCVDCNKICSKQCQHGQIHHRHVADRLILTKARATLPPCLKLGQSTVIGHLNTTGVFTKESLARQTEFGPLQGTLLPLSSNPESASFSHWKIFYEGSAQVLDVSDEKDSNWLMFMKPARNAMERNVVAFQRDHGIMFVTTKDVPQEAELLFWFAPDYCKMLLGSTKVPQYCPYCPTCSHVFFDRPQLHRHSRQVHGDVGVKKWPCSVCSAHFRSAGKLNDHVMTQHMNLKPHVCATCGKEFSDPRNLNTHLNIHTGIKKFGCDICGKHFMQKAHLQSHQATHTKVKSAECKVCSKRFTRFSDMRQHEMTHNQGNLLSCQQCSKTFLRPKLLRRHMRSVHSNIRNYMCERCSKTFHTKYKLTRHGQSCQSHKLLHTPTSSFQSLQKSSSSSSSSAQMSQRASVSSKVKSEPVISANGCPSQSESVGCVSVTASVSVCAAVSCSNVDTVDVVCSTVNGEKAGHSTSQRVGQLLQEGAGCPVSDDGNFSVTDSVMMVSAHKGSSLTASHLPVLVSNIN